MSLPAIAQHMSSYGRNGDSMLVHMTPSEVQGLQALAEKHGTTLTINPDTGLPEAFSLKSLVPIAAGAMLGPAGFGIATSAMGAAAMVGGVTALASGNLKQGLMAGLGAYGGYGLGAGLAGMGAETLTKEAGTVAAENAAQTANEIGMSTAAENTAAEAAKNTVAGQNAAATANELSMAGTPAPSSPIAADAGIKNMVQTTTQAPTFSQNFGNATAGFDRLTSPGGIDALSKQMAANSATAMGGPSSAMGGLGYSTAGALGMDAMSQKNPAAGVKASPGYIRPYTYDPFGQRYTAQTPVKADEWGSRSFNAADGGIVALAHGGAVQHYDAGGVTDAQIQEYVSAHMDDPAAIAAAAQQYGVSAEDLSRATGYSGEQVGNYFSDAGINASTFNPYTSYSNEQMGSFFANPANANVNVNDAIAQFNADPRAVNQYIASLSQGYYDPTTAQRGSGTLNTFQNLTGQGMTAGEFAAAMQANDPNWGKGYWNQGTVSRAFDVADKVLKFDPLTDKVSPSDKDWVKFMDNNELTVKDISLATGLTEAEVQARYDAAKEKPIMKLPVAPTPGIINTPSRPDVSVATPGDRTVNKDGSVTIHPNIPGRPDGGFTGMTGVKDVYTTGGGSLGYAPYAPKTAAEHDAMYNTTTGGSRAALDYLMGSGEYPTVPYTKTGEIMKPYSEAVMGMPANPTQFPFIWDAQLRRYVPNPKYVKPLTIAEQEAAAKAAEEAKDKEAAAAAEQKAFYGADGSANGGLLTLAGGGMSHLGDYSDGGRLLKGPGDGVSDSIPASIGNKQPARLADGEFVVPARIVSELGNGSTDAGARKLYQMMDRVQKARGKTTGKGKVAANSRADKYLPV